MWRKSYFIYILILASFCVGCLFFYGINYYYPTFFTRNTTTFYPLRESKFGDDQYQFIDPLLGIDRPDSLTSTQYVDLKNSINSLLDYAMRNNNLKIASIYIRDESTGRGFTINPDEKYSMASLIKVPIMISYYKLAENDPSILTKQIEYTGENDLNSDRSISSTIQLEKGKIYTVEQLIEYMIKYSDNNAYDLLVNNLNITDTYKYTDQLFKDLGIGEISFDKDYINIDAYSLFFRVLYNATYLDRDMSEKALKLLTETDFTEGIESGVPNNIVIAQKFGESKVSSTDGSLVGRELHNCGIIYYPEHPYLLCVMTKGDNLTQLENLITSISRTVFNYTEKSYSSTN